MAYDDFNGADRVSDVSWEDSSIEQLTTELVEMDDRITSLTQSRYKLRGHINDRITMLGDRLGKSDNIFYRNMNGEAVLATESTPEKRRF
jgi:hypothetical protein